MAAHGQLTDASAHVAAQKLTAFNQTLGQLAELTVRASDLRTRHEMTARANAEQRVRLQATYDTELLMEAAELEQVLAGLGDAEADQAALRQLTREQDVRAPPVRRVLWHVSAWEKHVLQVSAAPLCPLAPHHPSAAHAASR